MAVFFDQGVVSQVQQANDIVDVISEHVNLVKKGREMVGLCPFHDDHRPSMNVNAVKQIFKCFACGVGGDVFKFVQMREGLTFSGAIERLAERAGIKLQPRAQEARYKTQDLEIDPNMLARVNEWAAKYFEENLRDEKKGKFARDYLAQRQITPDSIKKWRIGVAVNSQDDLLKAATARNIPVKLLEQAGLVVKQGGGLSDKFVNRLMFTITDVTGRVIGFGGRIFEGEGAKYVNSPTTVLFDKSNTLYGLEQARHKIVSTGTAVVVEGYTDVIMAHSKGCDNVVAALGTSFTPGQGRILRRYAKKAVLIFDSDTAGMEAANRALEICLAQHIDIAMASVPEGKDPCDFLSTAGKERFEKLIDEAVDVFQFKWNRLAESFDRDETLAGRKSAVEEFLQTVATSLCSGNLTAIERGLIVNRLSKITGASTKEINDELHKRVGRAARTASYNVENKKVRSVDLGDGLFAMAQREILEVLLNEPKLFEIVKQKITAEDFDVPMLRRTASLLFETLIANSETSLAEIIARTESPEASSLIVELAQSGEAKGNFESRLAGALDVIGRHLAQKRKSEIKTVDGREYLRSVHENTGKQNLRSTGMV
ncbi:MAG: DNA primase [Phycisphaerae bacterium]|nr:DNA primase [Phycisphaerae bacterium]MDD5380756.1 DNA primase [Phycisphaerae bacterium]